ncbi:MAG: hypothetical protein CVT98_03415 [Bacteroidetes bacterium HGW-Bacteroidetes-15]|nr:MAG: hypothetical protein CVT98_03415 [Bacteroidetes bacterium HGW-Bacteroidetes-15]
METKVKLLIILFALMLSGLANAGERFLGQVKPFKGPNSNSKEVGSTISFITESHIPGTTVNLVFYYTYSTPDGEWDDGVSLDFPNGVFVNNASVCTQTGNEQLPYNGETGDGVVVTWGNINGGSGLGGLRSSGQFSVNVTISEDFTGPMSVEWYIAGDGFGASPNFNSGSIVLPQALDYDLAIVDFKPKLVILGADYVPVVSVRNVGIHEISSFTVNVLVPEFDYNQTISITTTIVANEVVQIEFPSYLPMVEGTYVATATITGGGGENEDNNELVVSGLVSPLAEAYAINGINLSYNEIDLSNGETVNVGTVDYFPWQMAEEFDGNNIYRINHDASFGTVDPDGTFHQLGIMTGVPGYPSGLAYNWETGVMYVVVQNEDTNHSHFCTLNKETYELTEIAESTSLILGMDFANNGYLYAVSFQNELIKFDPVTSEISIVGPLGIDILYPQDVSFDVETGLLYTIASGDYFSVFGTYDLNTGAFSQITDMNGVYYYTLVITKNPNDYYPVTFNVDMSPASFLDVNTDEVFVSGSMNDWTEPGDNQEYVLTKAENSMIYSATYNLKPGSYSYKYYVNNGWSGAEWSDSYPNRNFEVVDTDLTINDMWGNQTTSVNEMEFRVEIFPNPASSVITIVAEKEILDIRIIDMLGRTVHSQLVNSNSSIVNLDRLSSGLHIVYIATNEGMITRKLQIIK